MSYRLPRRFVVVVAGGGVGGVRDGRVELGLLWVFVCDRVGIVRDATVASESMTISHVDLFVGTSLAICFVVDTLAASSRDPRVARQQSLFIPRLQ